MKQRKLIVTGFLGGFAVVALLGLGPARSEAEQPSAPPAALHRVAALNGDAAVNATAALRQRSHASAEEADARIMREAEAQHR